MTDLSRVLPDFPVADYGALIPALEHYEVTTTELLTLDVAELARRTNLRPPDLTRLSSAVLHALHVDLAVAEPDPAARTPSTGTTKPPPTRPPPRRAQPPATTALRHTPAQLSASWSTITTLDPLLDAALAGGIPAGHVCEITGEAGAGKTNLLLSLLLAVQLPPPQGLGRGAVYVSTEAALATDRLDQMLKSNPVLLAASSLAPSLDGILSIVCPDLESQDHILTFQVPIAVERQNLGLLVVDSVAANFRAEFGAGSGSMAARGADLIRLGAHLRDLARRHNMAVVVANQVADRFTQPPPHPPLTTSEGLEPSAARLPARPVVPVRQSQREDDDGPPRRAPPPSEPTPSTGATHDLPALLLDHQQRWFTGWGDEEDGEPVGPHKTPALGLVWSTQIAARIAMIRRPVYGASQYDEEGDGLGQPTIRSWRRWMKVVFAAHAAESGPGLRGAVEFEIYNGGLRGLEPKGSGVKRKREDTL